jgi:hypothetical protein
MCKAEKGAFAMSVSEKLQSDEQVLLYEETDQICSDLVHPSGNVSPGDRC